MGLAEDERTLAIFASVALVLVLVLGYVSTKGVCKWTKGRGHFVGFLVHLLNIVTGGIAGVVANMLLSDECKETAE